MIARFGIFCTICSLGYANIQTKNNHHIISLENKHTPEVSASLDFSSLQQFPTNLFSSSTLFTFEKVTNSVAKKRIVTFEFSSPFTSEISILRSSQSDSSPTNNYLRTLYDFVFIIRPSDEIPGPQKPVKNNDNNASDDSSPPPAHCVKSGQLFD